MVYNAKLNLSKLFPVTVNFPDSRTEDGVVICTMSLFVFNPIADTVYGPEWVVISNNGTLSIDLIYNIVPALNFDKAKR